MITTYGSAAFKAQCLQILDTVAESGQAVLVTKRGKPVAQVVPFSSPTPPKVFGWMRGTAQWSDDLLSSQETWDADQS